MDITKQTLIESGSGVTVSLCDPVTLCAIHGLISLPPFISLGRNFFLRPFGPKIISQTIFFQGRGMVGPGPGAKKQWFVKLFHKILAWKLELTKLQKKITIFYKIKFWPTGQKWLSILVLSIFLQKIDPKLFCILNLKWSKNLIGCYMAGQQPCVWPKRPPTWGGPNHMRWQFFHKKTLWISML